MSCTHPESRVHPGLAGPSKPRPLACPLLDGVVYSMGGGCLAMPTSPVPFPEASQAGAVPAE